mgnify:CR=1 FL=1
MTPVPVQWITRELVLRLALTDGERERAAARWLLVGFIVVVCGFGLLLMGGW